MPVPCLVLPHSLGDGPAHMATDEAMLEWVASGDGTAALRTYEWSEPTLSLGYFQKRADAEPRWRDVPLVRRSTGGGAIWHDRELTYAVAVPAAHPLSRRAPDLYLAVHSAIIAMLASAGIAARRRGDFDGPPPRPFLCFADRDPEDVVVAGVKVVGSAQRRRSGAVLQQGSLLLRKSPPAAELPGLADLAPSASDDPAAWAPSLRSRVALALELNPQPGPMPPSLAVASLALEVRIYRSDPWTHRR